MPGAIHTSTCRCTLQLGTLGGMTPEGHLLGLIQSLHLGLSFGVSDTPDLGTRSAIRVAYPSSTDGVVYSTSADGLHALGHEGVSVRG